MVLFRVIICTIWVSILLIGSGMWSPDMDATPNVTIDVHQDAGFRRVHTDEHRRGTAAPRLDLYGNPVEPAVGDYRTDQRGDLYERHAPDTAILRLGPPTT